MKGFRTRAYKPRTNRMGVTRRTTTQRAPARGYAGRPDGRRVRSTGTPGWSHRGRG